MKFSMTKKEMMFLPTTEQDQEQIAKLKDGDYLLKVSQIRCPIRHREFFGILNLVFENLPEKSDCVSSRELLVYIQEQVTLRYWNNGVYECVAGRINNKGKFIPTSIAFENMSQDDFDEFTKHAYQIMAKWMGMSVLDLLEWYRNQ